MPTIKKIVHDIPRIGEVTFKITFDLSTEKFVCELPDPIGDKLGIYKWEKLETDTFGEMERAVNRVYNDCIEADEQIKKRKKMIIIHYESHFWKKKIRPDSIVGDRIRPGVLENTYFSFQYEVIYKVKKKPGKYADTVYFDLDGNMNHTYEPYEIPWTEEREEFCENLLYTIHGINMEVTELLKRQPKEFAAFIDSGQQLKSIELKKPTEEEKEQILIIAPPEEDDDE